MENKVFKKVFSELAEEHHLTSAFGGWYKQSGESLVAFELQKSNFSNLYYLNIYIYLNGYNDEIYKSVTKELIRGKRKIFFRREDKSFSRLFDLENSMSDAERIRNLQIFFNEWLIPFSEKALTKNGIIELIRNQQLGGSNRTIEKINELLRD